MATNNFKRLLEVLFLIFLIGIVEVRSELNLNTYPQPYKYYNIFDRIPYLTLTNFYVDRIEQKIIIPLSSSVDINSKLDEIVNELQKPYPKIQYMLRLTSENQNFDFYIISAVKNSTHCELKVQGKEYLKDISNVFQGLEIYKYSFENYILGSVIKSGSNIVTINYLLLDRYLRKWTKSKGVVVDIEGPEFNVYFEPQNLPLLVEYINNPGNGFENFTMVVMDLLNNISYYDINVTIEFQYNTPYDTIEISEDGSIDLQSLNKRVYLSEIQSDHLLFGNLENQESEVQTFDLVDLNGCIVINVKNKKLLFLKRYDVKIDTNICHVFNSDSENFKILLNNSKHKYLIIVESDISTINGLLFTTNNITFAKNYNATQIMSRERKILVKDSEVYAFTGNKFNLNLKQFVTDLSTLLGDQGLLSKITFSYYGRDSRGNENSTIITKDLVFYLYGYRFEIPNAVNYDLFYVFNRSILDDVANQRYVLRFNITITEESTIENFTVMNLSYGEIQIPYSAQNDPQSSLSSYSYNYTILDDRKIEVTLMLPRFTTHGNIDFSQPFYLTSVLDTNKTDFNVLAGFFFDSQTPDFDGLLYYKNGTYKFVSDTILLRYEDNLDNNKKFKLKLNIYDDDFLVSNNFWYYLSFNSSDVIVPLQDRCLPQNCEIEFQFNNIDSENLCEYLEKPQHMKIAVIDPSGKVWEKEYQIILLNSEYITENIAVCEDTSNDSYSLILYTNKQIYKDTLKLPLVTSYLNLTQIQCSNPVEIQFKIISQNLPEINYTLILNETLINKYSEFLCFFEFNNAFMLKYNFSIFYDIKPPEISFKEVRFDKSGPRNSTSDVILNNTLFIPENYQNLRISLDVIEDLTWIKNVKITGLINNEEKILYAFDFVDNNFRELPLTLTNLDNISKIILFASDVLDNNITKEIKIVPYILVVRRGSVINEDYVPFSEYDSSENFWRIYVSKPNIRMIYLFSTQEKVPVELLPDIFSISTYLSFKPENLNYSENFSGSELILNFEGLNEGNIIEGGLIVMDKYNLEYANEKYYISRYFGFSAEFIPEIVGSKYPEEIRFHFNRPVKSCDVSFVNQKNNKIYLERFDSNPSEPFSISINDPAKIGTFFDELFTYKYEDTVYYINLSCIDFADQVVKAVVSTRHDSFIVVPTLELKSGALVDVFWNRMSRLITHPGAEITFRLSPANNERVRCFYYYFLENEFTEVTEINAGNMIDKDLTFSVNVPHREGVYLWLLNCTDDIGNEVVHHISQLNVTLKPIKTSIKFYKIYSSPMSITVVSTKPITCKNPISNLFRQGSQNVNDKLYYVSDSFSTQNFFNKISCQIDNQEIEVPIDIDNDMLDLDKGFNYSYVFDNRLNRVNFSAYMPRDGKLWIYPKYFEELAVFYDRIRGKFFEAIPVVDTIVSLKGRYDSLLEEPVISKQIDETFETKISDFVVGKILHPINNIMYNYVIFEIFSNKTLTDLLQNVRLIINNRNISLNDCRFIVYRTGRIFVCPALFENTHYRLELYYKNTLLDSEQVPDISYILLNIMPGSYNRREYNLEIKFASEIPLGEPMLWIFDSDQSRFEQINLSKSVSYLNYNADTKKIEGIINLKMIFSESLIKNEQEKKFVVYIKADPVLSNPVPLFIDLKKPRVVS
ncbi:MAG: hypothetical protein QXD62_03250 [Candidatus Woesearchaeota archaeon]